MAPRTTRQWIVAIFSVIITLGFLAVSFAPLVTSLLSPPAQTSEPKTKTLSSEDRIKAEIAGYEKVLVKEPTNRFALQNIVNLRNQIGDTKGTIQPLQTLASAYPNQPVYRLTLARTYLELKQDDAAITEYRNVLAIDPGNQDALSRLVSVELSKSRPGAAVEILTTALDKATEANQVKPNSVDIPTINLLLGDLYLQLDRLEEAEEVYLKVKKEDSKDFRPLLGEAFIRRAQKQEDAAQKLFAKAKDLAPEAVKSRIDELATPAAPKSTPSPAPSAPLPESK